MKLTIIGGGPGGYTAAFAAAKAGVEVTLVERAHLGGTCLHTGCIPTKTLRSSADALDTVARLREFGIAGDCAATPDMSAIVARKRKVTATLQTGLEKTAAQLKVRVVRGDAEFVGAGLVRVASVDGSLEIAGDRVILATGSSPLELPSLPVDHRLVLSSDDALELQTVPEHLVVVGLRCESDGHRRAGASASPAIRRRRNQPFAAPRNEEKGHRRGTVPYGFPRDPV